MTEAQKAMASLRMSVVVGATLALVACQTPRGLSTIEVYSSIVADPETTHAGGVEVELRRAGAAAKVLLVHCAGGCHGAEATDVTLEASAVSLSWRHPLAPRGDSPERFVLRRAGGGLVVEQPTWAKGEILRRVPRPNPGQTRGWAAYH